MQHIMLYFLFWSFYLLINLISLS